MLKVNHNRAQKDKKIDTQKMMLETSHELFDSLSLSYESLDSLSSVMEQGLAESRSQSSSDRNLDQHENSPDTQGNL